MNGLWVEIETIEIPDRMRKDYGDVQDLADSLDRLGQLQPIVLNNENVLIAGGRRLEAAKLAGWKHVKSCFIEVLSEDVMAEMELEENVRRKAMSWQERCLAIGKIHRLKAKEAMASQCSWGSRETAELLGFGSNSNVFHAIEVSLYLTRDDEDIKKQSNLKDAYKILVRRKRERAEKYLAERMAKESVASEVGTTSISDEAKPESLIIPLSKMIFCGESISMLPDFKIDHIISDPPYAIDMANLAQTHQQHNDIEDVVDTHDMRENLALHACLIAEAPIPDRGFLILWCDAMQFPRLVELGIAHGYSVQRWPLTWVKTHRCMNQRAESNFTKTTEFAVVMRKTNTALVAPQATSHYSCSNPPKKLHPFDKPLDVWKWILRATVRPDERVLDPFAGSGSCLEACVDLGISFYGIEIDETHYNTMIVRLQEAFVRKHPTKKVKFV